MDKVQNKPNSSVQHKPSSESFQVYQLKMDLGFKQLEQTVVGEGLFGLVILRK
jgi:hypothetical protein